MKIQRTVLEEGVELCKKNILDYLEEARVIAETGSLNHAYVLVQFAIEELGKALCLEDELRYGAAETIDVSETIFGKKGNKSHRIKFERAARVLDRRNLLVYRRIEPRKGVISEVEEASPELRLIYAYVDFDEDEQKWHVGYDIEQTRFLHLIENIEEEASALCNRKKRDILRVGRYYVPDGLYYSRQGCWAKVEVDKVRIGITDYAQKQFGEIMFVELPNAGDLVGANTYFGSIGSVVDETLAGTSDLISPLSGITDQVNMEVTKEPAILNKDPFGKGWLLVITPSNLHDELHALMNFNASVEWHSKLVEKELKEKLVLGEYEWPQAKDKVSITRDDQA